MESKKTVRKIRKRFWVGAVMALAIALALVATSVVSAAGAAGSTTTLTRSPDTDTVFGETITFIATVTGSGGTPTGQVTFYDGATELGSDTLDPSGQATVVTDTLSAGLHPIKAVYDGSENFSPSTSERLFHNVTFATWLTRSPDTDTVFGETITFIATVTGSGGTPTGQVTFWDGVTEFGSDTLDAFGQATLSTSTLAVGTHPIKAVYGGSENFSPSASERLYHNVTFATCTASITSNSPQCFCTSINFDGSASGGTPPYRYSWGFGGAGTRTDAPQDDQHPSYHYDNPGTYTVTLEVIDANGCSNTCTKQVTVLQPTVIDVQPPFIHFCFNPGGPCTLSVPVQATGEEPLSYQWKRNGVDLTDGGSISDATTSTLTITNPGSGDVGIYSVEVTGGCGSASADRAELSVRPEITTQPANQSVCPGNDVTFSVQATGAPPLYYQWKKDGTDLSDGGRISGATTATLTITDVKSGDEGAYTVWVAAHPPDYLCGVTSNGATLEVTTVDTTPTTITCPDDVIIECGASTDPSDTGSATASDSCDPDPQISYSDSAEGGTDPQVVSVITRTWTATDAGGNSSSCDQTITVKDTTPPTAVCRDITIQLDDTGNASITADGIDNGSSDACGIKSLTASKTDFTCTDVGRNTVTLTVTDENDNVSTCTATVTVEDNVPPDVECKNVTVQKDASGSFSFDIWEIVDHATDACGITSWAVHDTSFDDRGVMHPILTVTDNNGNKSTCTATVTLKVDPALRADLVLALNLPPECFVVERPEPPPPGPITCPPNRHVGCNPTLPDDVMPEKTGYATSSYPRPRIEYIDSSRVNGCVTVITRLWIAIDDENSRSACCTQLITYTTGTTAPSTVKISEPSSGCEGEAVGPWTITWDDDSCNGPWTVDYTIEHDNNNDGTTEKKTGSIKGIKEKKEARIPAFTWKHSCNRDWGITVTVTNDCGLSSDAYSSTVTVNDCEDPTITCPDDIETCNDEGECSAAVDPGPVRVTDNCTVTVSDVRSDGKELTDPYPVGKTTITRTAEDSAGNEATCEQTVTVSDCEAPTVICPSNITQDTDLDACSASVLFAATAIDNCSATTTYSISGTMITSPHTFPVGTATVTATATDPADNTDSCTFTVTVVDNQDPTITCPDDIETCNDPGACGAVVTYTAPVGTDNCSGATTTQIAGLGSGATFPVGTTTETYEVTDAAGNTARCGFDVTVNDCEDPKITCPDDFTIECHESTDPTNTGQATATDNCDQNPQVTYTDSVNLNGCGGYTGTITRTWTATDAWGNSSECTQTISVQDTTLPELIVPDPATFECDGAGNTNDINAWLASASATDNCGSVSLTNDYAGLTGVCSGTGSATVTFTATDECGNVTTATSTATVVDTTPPVANDDSTTTDEDTPVIIDVLANDSDLCSTVLTIVAVGDPAHGTATIVGNAILYTPAENYYGLDQFTYTIEDCSGNSATATVTVTINSINDAPVALDQSLTTCKNTPLTITLEATDPEVDPDPVGPQPHPSTFTIYGTPAPGATVNGPLGNVTYSEPHTASVVVTYTPAQDFLGEDSFTFLVEDPFGAFAIGTVRITVEECEEEAAGGGGAIFPAVVINEVAWAGTEADSQDEWIELLNNTDETVDLTGWTLRWKRKQPATRKEENWKVVELIGTIAPSGFYLLERRHNETVSDLDSDLLYDTVPPYQLELVDLGEVMELVDADGGVVDTANADRPERDGWAAGTGPNDVPPFGTMERIDPLSPDLDDNWATNRHIIINGRDAQTDLLTATAVMINENTLIRALEDETPQVVQLGEQITVTIAVPTGVEVGEGLPQVILARVDEAAGGGGAALEAADQAAALSGAQVEGLPNYALSLDTSELAPGTYRLWITMGNGVFHHLLIEVVEE